MNPPTFRLMVRYWERGRLVRSNNVPNTAFKSSANFANFANFCSLTLFFLDGKKIRRKYA